MRHKLLASLTLTAGLAVLGTSIVSAAEYYPRDTRSDYAAIESLRREIARDQARLNDDLRHGRRREAARDREELARDQRALEARLRSLRRYDRNSWR